MFVRQRPSLQETVCPGRAFFFCFRNFKRRSQLNFLVNAYVRLTVDDDWRSSRLLSVRNLAPGSLISRLIQERASHMGTSTYNQQFCDREEHGCYLLGQNKIAHQDVNSILVLLCGDQHIFLARQGFQLGLSRNQGHVAVMRAW